MNQKKINRTNTSLFLLQGIGLSVHALKDEGFINAYIGDSVGHHYPYGVYLLFKPDNPQEFTEFFIGSEYMRTPLLIDDYDYSGGYIVLVYSFPPEFESDYNKFLHGDYSKFSKEYKALFPMSIDSEDEVGPFEQHSFYYHVFNKTKDMEKYWLKRIGQKPDKDGEYWSVPITDDEILDIEKIRK